MKQNSVRTSLCGHHITYTVVYSCMCWAAHEGKTRRVGGWREEGHARTHVHVTCTYSHALLALPATVYALTKQPAHPSLLHTHMHTHMHTHTHTHTHTATSQPHRTAFMYEFTSACLPV
mmetsp:Transcript_40903/g.116524  ORF Transcript_40903/g.116524 Transcript_40903/m.116524 type:complete len:119 (-) Transcript_40903:1368-1724(-)